MKRAWVSLLTSLLALAVTGALALGGCSERAKAPAKKAAPTSTKRAKAPALADGRFTRYELRRIQSLLPPKGKPTDETNAVFHDPRAQHLGRWLFYDSRLSKDGDTNCSSCHQPDHGFTILAPLGRGEGKVPRHTPGLINVAYQPWFDWDGKADALWAQAVRPMESPAEQATTRMTVVRIAVTDPKLRAAYEAIFGPMPPALDRLAKSGPRAARPVLDDPKHPHHVAWMKLSEADREVVDRAFTNLTKTIAAYEGQLVSYDSAFDRYARALLSGDPQHADLKAISPQARDGLKLFLTRAKCINCHNGPNFTDGAFHNLGLPDRPWFRGRKDEGRWNGVKDVKTRQFNSASAFSDARDGTRARWLKYLTNTREDHGQFKTATLRNVAKTNPYMHGGHFDTLEQVVTFYSTLPGEATVGHREDALTPLNLTAKERDALVAFLKTLTSAPLPKALLDAPKSPVLARADAPK